MYRSILVPLDGSPLAEHALPFAASIARRSNASLHVALVHVPDAYTQSTLSRVEEVEWESKAREQEYLENLQTRISAAFEGTVDVHHPEGIVPETLCAEVARHGVDLVVMNAQGWGYVSRALLGSVSDYLMRHLNVPLLMMHTGGVRAEIDRPVAFRRVLIPLDGSDLAATIVNPALALGDLWQAEYHLLRVVASARELSAAAREHPYPLPRSVQDENVTAAGDYLSAMASELRSQTRSVQTQVVVNRNTTAAVLQEAATAACDLIAISTHGRGGLSRLLLGSVADKVVRGAHTPVLVYRPESDE